MRLIKILAGIAIVLIIAVVGVAIYISTLDPNEYRGLIAEQVKSATGREFAIDGPMEFRLSLSPTLQAQDISLSNAAWGSRKEMVTLKQLDVQLSLVPLLFGNVEVSRIVLVKPDILLETNAKGEANWSFRPSGEAAAHPAAGGGDAGSAPALPRIGEVRIEDGRLHYRDGVTKSETVIAPLDVTGTSEGANEPLLLTVRTVVNGTEVSAEGRIGPLQRLMTRDAPAELDFTVTAAGLTAAIKGQAHLPEVSAAIDVSADDLVGLRPIAGDAVPAGQPLSLKAQVDAGADLVKVSGLSLTLGASDLSGDASVALGGARPAITAKLSGKKLDLASLLPAGADAGGDSGGSASGGTKPGKVFPSDQLPLDGLKAVDATVDLKVGEIILPQLAARDVDVALKLNNGKLAVDPIKASLAGSPLAASLTLDAAASTPGLSLMLKAEKFDVGRLLQESGATDLLEGKADVAVDLKGAGGSVAALMGSLDGQSNILMGQGRVRTAAFDALVGGLSQVLGTLFAEKKEWTVLNCAASRFAFKKGIAESQVMLFDTEYSTVVGEGQIDLGKETLGLTVSPQAKSATLNVAVPVKVGGTLAEPTFRPDELATARRLGGLLGTAVFPPAALLAFGDLGSGDDNPCLKIASGKGGGAAKPEGGAAAPAGDSPSNPLDAAGKGLKKLFGN